VVAYFFGPHFICKHRNNHFTEKSSASKGFPQTLNGALLLDSTGDFRLPYPLLITLQPPWETLPASPCWHRGLVFRMPVLTDGLFLIYAWSMVDMWPLYRQSVRYRSTYQTNSAFHPFGAEVEMG